MSYLKVDATGHVEHNSFIVSKYRWSTDLRCFCRYGCAYNMKAGCQVLPPA